MNCPPQHSQSTIFISTAINKIWKKDQKLGIQFRSRPPSYVTQILQNKSYPKINVPGQNKCNIVNPLDGFHVFDIT